MDINEEAYAIQEEVVEFRRALHRCPEIAFHETMTMEYIREGQIWTHWKYRKRQDLILHL